MVNVSNSQAGILARQMTSVTKSLSTRQAVRNLSTADVARVAGLTEQRAIADSFKENALDVGVAGYSDVALNGLSELVTLAQQLVTLGQQAHQPAASTAEREELNAAFQAIKAAIDAFIPGVMDSAGNPVLGAAAGAAINYGAAAALTPPALNDTVALAQVTADPIHAALAVNLFEIEQQAQRPAAMTRANIMLGRYSGQIAAVQAIDNFLKNQSDSLASRAAELQDEIDNSLNPNIATASKKLTVIAGLMQMVNATRTLFAADKTKEAGTLAQSVASAA